MDEICRCVRALAQPAPVQLGLFPSFACAGEELALEFDEALRAFRRAGAPTTAEQAFCLANLDRYLLELSKPSEEEFWCNPSSLSGDPRWDEVRSLARAVLSSFGWANEPPPRNGATYVSVDGVVRNE